MSKQNTSRKRNTQARALPPPPPSAREGLLRAIHDDPHNDSLHLVLADWLEDNGDPARADYIRTQVEIDELFADDPRLIELYRREKDLRRRYWGLWLGPFFDLEEANCTSCRGLLIVKVCGDTLIDASQELPASGVERDWFVRDLSVNMVSGVHFPVLLNSPLLPHVTSLRMAESGAVTRLASLATLTRLRSLHTGPGVLGNQLLAALSSSPFFNQLVCLDLSGNHGITAVGLRSLVTALQSGSLKRLVLSMSPLSDEAVQPLAESPTMVEVNQLDLQNTDIGDAGAEAFLGSPFLEADGYLFLTGNRISRRVAQRLRRRYRRVFF